MTIFNYISKTINLSNPVRDLSSVANNDKSMLRTEHGRFFMEQTATRAPRIGVAFFYRTFMPTAYNSHIIDCGYSSKKCHYHKNINITQFFRTINNFNYETKFKI
ncbi:MAG: hypothetical protein LBQ28_00805 [Prevotellaceae bacterium]|jgi:hypothetical protein|nr:hypothetical protein [Prevotellaceae bacterium]